MRLMEKSHGKFSRIVFHKMEDTAIFQESQEYHTKILSKLQEIFESVKNSTKKPFLLKISGV